MNRLPSSFWLRMILPLRTTLVAGVCAFAVLTGWAQRGVPIEFSKPTDGGFATNLYGLVAPEEGRSIRDRLQESQLSPGRLFKDNDPTAPIQMVPVRPRVSAAATKRQREELDRKKNWAFTMDEELGQDPTTTEISKLTGADRRDKNGKSETVMDRYLGRVSDTARDPVGGDSEKKRSGQGDSGTSPSEKQLDQQANQAESVLRSLFDANPTGRLAARLERESGSGDLEETALTSSGLAAQRSRMSEFMQLLEGRPGEATTVRPEPSRSSGLSALSAASAGAASSPISSSLSQLAGDNAAAVLPAAQPRLPSASPAYAPRPLNLLTPLPAIPQRRQ